MNLLKWFPKVCLFLLSVNLLLEFTQAEETLPNIILIIGDDLGFNDVSFHGATQIPTPNIDALAFTGIILNSYYVSPICTPTRTAIFSGIHPIHTGMQHDVIYGATPFGFPLDKKILPEYLKDYNYSTHLVGKWHMGHFRLAYTPTCRGFDTHYGSWTGHKDYYDNMAQEEKPQAWGYDMRRNFKTTYENIGKYTTDLYTEEAIRIIKDHGNKTKENQPLFLTISHTAVHSANPYSYLQAPREVVERFSYIKDINRRKYAAMVYKMDESVGLVVKALSQTGLLSNSIIIFTTDNGGPAAGFNNNVASNWPLRGVKNTLWEGGVRGAALLWSPLLHQFSSVHNGLFHVEDWLPTLLYVINKNFTDTLSNEIDGVNQWNSLNNPEKSPRNEILHNIDDIYGNEALRIGHWKLMKGTTYGGKWDSWYGPSGRDSDQNSGLKLLYSAVDSVAGNALKSIVQFPNEVLLFNILKNASINCKQDLPNSTTTCNLKSGEYCLFNIFEDPCELKNLAKTKGDILNSLKLKLGEYRKTMVQPINKPKDPRGQPKFWKYTWTNWMDFVEPLNKTFGKCGHKYL